MLEEKTLSPRMGSYQTFYVIHTYVKKMFEKKRKNFCWKISGDVQIGWFLQFGRTGDG